MPVLLNLWAGNQQTQCTQMTSEGMGRDNGVGVRLDNFDKLLCWVMVRLGAMSGHAWQQMTLSLSEQAHLTPQGLNLKLQKIDCSPPPPPFLSVCLAPGCVKLYVLVACM